MPHCFETPSCAAHSLPCHLLHTHPTHPQSGKLERGPADLRTDQELESSDTNPDALDPSEQSKVADRKGTTGSGGKEAQRRSQVRIDVCLDGQQSVHTSWALHCVQNACGCASCLRAQAVLPAAAPRLGKRAFAVAALQPTPCALSSCPTCPSTAWSPCSCRDGIWRCRPGRLCPGHRWQC
jgi:hypothetical protein